MLAFWIVLRFHRFHSRYKKNLPVIVDVPLLKCWRSKGCWKQEEKEKDEHEEGEGGEEEKEYDDDNNNNNNK